MKTALSESPGVEKEIMKEEVVDVREEKARKPFLRVFFHFVKRWRSSFNANIEIKLRPSNERLSKYAQIGSPEPEPRRTGPTVPMARPLLAHKSRSVCARIANGPFTDRDRVRFLLHGDIAKTGGGWWKTAAVSGRWTPEEITNLNKPEGF